MAHSNIIKVQPLKVLGEPTFGRIIFRPPFKAGEQLKNEARFCHVVRGNSRLIVPNDHFDLQSKDSFLMKAENFVNNWKEVKGEDSAEMIIIHFRPDVLNYIYNGKLPDFFFKKQDVQPCSVEKIAFNGLLGHYIEGLRQYFDNPILLSDDLIKVKMQELVQIMINSDPSGHVLAILSDLFNHTEYEFKDVVHANLYEDLSLEELAMLSGMSLSTFKRKFKDVFKTSPKQYIIGKRLTKAAGLLKQTQDRISEIAYACGFNDVGYFSKSFTAHFNQSPSVYREALEA